ncbi:hypothetical protein P7C71_g1241, partial [Lecanoromycetidae sp. Uapishka_2]
MKADIEDSRFFELDEARYIAWPSTHSLSYITLEQEDGTLATIIPIESWPIDAAWLHEYVDSRLEDDDVLRLEFLSGIVFVGPAIEENTSPEVDSLLQRWGTTWTKYVLADSNSYQGGPHLTVGKALWRVFRLYDDVQNAFLITVKGPNKEGKYELLNDGKHGWQCSSVAVPTRMSNATGKPFEGWRIALEDAFDVTGLRTSMCNRAYLDLYPPATSTAPAIKILIDGGASIGRRVSDPGVQQQRQRSGSSSL